MGSNVVVVRMVEGSEEHILDRRLDRITMST